MQGICLDWLVGSICLLYICIVLYLAVGVVVCKASMINWLCTGIQGIYALLTGGSRPKSGCIGMQGICLDWLVGSICLLYICIVLYLAVGVVVCKASVPNWLGVSICLLYICNVLDLAVGVVVCKASMINWLCTGIQGIYAWLTGGSRPKSGCIVMQGICLDWLVGSICLLYICIVLYLAVGVVVCKASVLNWLGVSICLLYICIVLDLAVAVVVCKASIFNWLCTGIQGIYA